MRWGQRLCVFQPSRAAILRFRDARVRLPIGCSNANGARPTSCPDYGRFLLTFMGGHLSNRRGRIVQFAASLFVAMTGLSWALNSHAAPPLLASPALARQLQQRVTLTWDDQEVAAALERLAEVQRVPLWIDRRIDPHARLSL